MLLLVRVGEGLKEAVGPGGQHDGLAERIGNASQVTVDVYREQGPLTEWPCNPNRHPRAVPLDLCRQAADVANRRKATLRIVGERVTHGT